MGARHTPLISPELDADAKAVLAINNLQPPQDWYAVAKLHAECRHRSLPHLSNVDISVFNYFNHNQDIFAGFLMTFTLREIRDKKGLMTSLEYILRHLLHLADFHELVSALRIAPATNTAVDCYSRAPIDKPALLAAMQEKFELQYETTEATAGVNASGSKPYFYSLNTRAANFGYQPDLTSLGGILQEATAILQQQTTHQVGSR